MSPAAKTDPPDAATPEPGVVIMPIDMTEEEQETALKSAREIDSFDFRDPEDEDDYYSAWLYKTPDGRHFRLVPTAGMNSYFAGYTGTAEWLSDEELEHWSQFP
jgi:hypothetical protein